MTIDDFKKLASDYDAYIFAGIEKGCAKEIQKFLEDYCASEIRPILEDIINTSSDASAVFAASEMMKDLETYPESVKLEKTKTGIAVKYDAKHESLSKLLEYGSKVTPTFSHYSRIENIVNDFLKNNPVRKDIKISCRQTS